MIYHVTVLPDNRILEVPAGTNLLQALRVAGLAPDAPCGGQGSCGKCRVVADGREWLSCQTVVSRDMAVTLPRETEPQVLTQGMDTQLTGGQDGFLLCFDIGTTTIAGFLLDGRAGKELARAGQTNPQKAWGADVISRVRAALDGEMEALTQAIRDALAEMTRSLCDAAHISPASVKVVSIVGNSAMQQLFLGISPENLAKIPFAAVITESDRVPAASYLPLCTNAQLLIVPDIAGFVGADTVACVLATGMYREEAVTLLVDIGTNGELVLGNRDGMVCCATAAGPALEGAAISCGMRAATGAIDRVWMEDGKLQYHVIGDVPAKGICGSGLIDAVAVLLIAGHLNKRGVLQNCSVRDGKRYFPLTDSISITQEDVWQFMLAKGAIAAGIRLLIRQQHLRFQDIDRVILAGAFGSHLNIGNACKVGLFPPGLEDRIRSVGNAAGSGAKLLATDPHALALCDRLVKEIRFTELAKLPAFSGLFARSMGFEVDA